MDFSVKVRAEQKIIGRETSDFDSISDGALLKDKFEQFKKTPTYQSGRKIR